MMMPSAAVSRIAPSSSASAWPACGSAGASSGSAAGSGSDSAAAIAASSSSVREKISASAESSSQVMVCSRASADTDCAPCSVLWFAEIVTGVPVPDVLLACETPGST